MDLRFEVSPSEAGVVVGGLHAQGFSAAPDNRRLGDTETYVTVKDLNEDAADEVRAMMLVLDSTAREA